MVTKKKVLSLIVLGLMSCMISGVSAGDAHGNLHAPKSQQASRKDERQAQQALRKAERKAQQALRKAERKAQQALRKAERQAQQASHKV